MKFGVNSMIFAGFISKLCESAGRTDMTKPILEGFDVVFGKNMLEATSWIHCAACGNNLYREYARGAKFCGECGQPLPQWPDDGSMGNGPKQEDLAKLFRKRKDAAEGGNATEQSTGNQKADTAEDGNSVKTQNVNAHNNVENKMDVDPKIAQALRKDANTMQDLAAAFRSGKIDRDDFVNKMAQLKQHMRQFSAKK